jgi:hypothetical protein
LRRFPAHGSTLLDEGRHLSTNWKRRQGGPKVARKWRREWNCKSVFSEKPSQVFGFSC